MTFQKYKKKKTKKKRNAITLDKCFFVYKEN